MPGSDPFEDQETSLSTQGAVGLGSQIISAAMQIAFFVFYCSTAAFSRHGFITSDAKQRVPNPDKLRALELELAVVGSILLLVFFF